MKQPELVLLFDGECTLCNGLIKFIIRHDKKKLFNFASLQSPAGKKLLNKFPTGMEKNDSVVLISDGKSYIKSEAIFRIADYIGGGWRMMKVFRILPASFLNFCYDAIAQMRYRIFGKQNSCMLPSQDILKKI
jgi:predicted DCC family thiol-disulfide oxidoreductase YuxK